jgi:leucyl aminopeptidase (aminopeptidase T)
MDIKRQSEAFKILFSRCLNVAGTDDLLTIYDESLEPFVDAFEATVESEVISCTRVFLPKKYQESLVTQSKAHESRDVGLPSGMVAAIQASTTILNLLSGSVTNAPVRKAVNQTPRPKNCRLATIPGISERILDAILEAPFDDVLQSCEEVAWVLGEANNAEIKTFDSSEKEYCLQLKLGGWENEPIMSPGILLPGSWGNVPPGETFCCPPYGTVNGIICISGSIPGSVLASGEEVVLEFVGGKLISWTCPVEGQESPALRYFEDQMRRGAQNGDDNWNTFAELGIGLNPKITDLTGNSLFDEKAIKTLHIAIGDNSVFGDDISSFIHADLVTRRPSLVLDGHVVMDRGVIDHAAIQQRRTAFIPSDGMETMDAVIHLSSPW